MFCYIRYCDEISETGLTVARLFQVMTCYPDLMSSIFVHFILQQSWEGYQVGTCCSRFAVYVLQPICVSYMFVYFDTFE